MGFEEYSIPFLSNEDIKERARKFKEKFWGDNVPIDIERIIDLSLEMDIVPVPGLQKLCGADALITSSWMLIYIDREAYLDERYQNRLRFSLAHEIGHFVLHRDIYKGFHIEEFSDFYAFLKHISARQYGYLETQANKFASYLLVPRGILAVEKKKQLNRARELKTIDSGTLNAYLAIPLSKVFGVSEKVIEIALNELNK